MPGERSRPARPHVATARLGRITQGTVFNCATAFRYAGKQVFGLTITARCDVAQEKYRLLNYVPIVRLDDWLLVDGLDILLQNERRDQDGRLKSELKQNDLSPNLSISVSLQEIIALHFSDPGANKKTKAAKTRLEKLSADIAQLSGTCGDPASALEWLMSNRSKAIRALIKDLFEHKVLGYYFLERLSTGSETDGYVCLLREVSSLPREIAEELARGISKARWTDLNGESHISGLDFEADDFASPVAQIESPSIEHIMQTYANLFGRIGIADADPVEIDQVAERYQHTTESET